jgi:hypothetical protein
MGRPGSGLPSGVEHVPGDRRRGHEIEVPAHERAVGALARVPRARRRGSCCPVHSGGQLHEACGHVLEPVRAVRSRAHRAGAGTASSPSRSHLRGTRRHRRPAAACRRQSVRCPRSWRRSRAARRARPRLRGARTPRAACPAASTCTLPGGTWS